MADGDGNKRQPERYEERACPKCGEFRAVRKDQPQTKLCRSCAKRGTLSKRKGTGIKNDPEKLGSWNSYHNAKARCKSGEHYTEVEFNFANFDEWWAELGERPEGMSVDRIDVYGNYEPGNVRWATQSEQNRNRRPRRWAKRPE